MSKNYIVVLWAIFVVVFLANSWVVDDAYITFRCIDNWHEGFGLRWNAVERVQAFTHPLWMLCISLCHTVTREFFYTSLAVSGLMCVTAIWFTLRQFAPNEQWRAFPLFLLLFCSKAFIDFTSSGLENPLSYLLIALFYGRLLFGERDLQRDTGLYFLLASLAFVNRMDTILLYLPALLYFVYQAGRNRQFRALVSMVLSTLPAFLWMLVSIVYFGFPFPNTYYAKAASTGISALESIRYGFAHYLNSLAWDPTTLVVIGVVLFIIARRGTTRPRLAATGVVLYLIYILRTGATSTHMSGRFFSVPYFLAVLLVLALPLRPRSGFALSALLVLIIVIWPMSPLKANTAYYRAGRDGSGYGRNGIIDTRYLVQVNDGSSLYNFERQRPMPNMYWYDEGLQFQFSSESVRVGGHGPAIGFFGFAAGPHKTIIDSLGLTDALLARLPADSNWSGGHFQRKLPAGYEVSVRTGRNQIVDPNLHAYYDKLLLVTQGPLFSAARFRATWDLNWGPAQAQLRSYVSRYLACSTSDFAP